MRNEFSPQRLIALVALMLTATIALPATARAEYDWEWLLESGTAHPSLPGEVFVDFETPHYVLADDGRILFAAKDGDFNSGFFMLHEGELRLLLKQGAPAPGTPGHQLPMAGGGFFQDGVMGNMAPNGVVEFMGNMVDPSGALNVFGAIYRVGTEADATLTAHFLEGMTIGGEQQNVRWAPAFTGEFATIFVGPLSSGEMGLALEQNASIGSPSYQFVAQPGGGEPRFGDVRIESVTPPAVNASGRMLYSLQFYNRDTRKFFSAACVREADGTTYYPVDDIVSTDFLNMQEVQIAEDGSMAFYGHDPLSTARGIYRISVPQGSSVHVRAGTFAPGTGGQNFAWINSWALVGNDVVYFTAAVDDGRMGLWRSDPFSIEVVAFAGDQVPDRPDGRLFGDSRVSASSGFGSVQATAGGTVFFTSRIEGSGAPFFGTGLFAIRAGEIHSVIHSGDRVAGSAVDWIDVAGSQYSRATLKFGINGQSGLHTASNAHGDIVFGVQCVNGRRFVLLGSSAMVVNSTGDRPDADPSDEICSCDPLGQVPDGVEPECTLRAALEQANADSELDRIRFAIDGAAPWVISPATPLPVIVHPVDIEGPTDGTGALAPRPEVVLESGGATGVGLHLATQLSKAAVVHPSAIRNLAIDGFDTGILVEQNGTQLSGNWLGVDPWAESLTALGIGVHARGVTGPSISTSRIDGDQAAVQLENCTGAKIWANYIGDGADERIDVPVAALTSTGILVQEGGNHLIGGIGFDDANVIGGVKIGIHLATANDCQVRGNRIGLDANGASFVRNQQTGIQLTAARRNWIGLGTEQAGSFGGNTIAASPFGIRVRGVSSEHNSITGNLLGALVNGGADPVPGEIGIEVSQGAFRTTVGGRVFGNHSAGNEIHGYGPVTLEHGGGILLKDDIQSDVLGNLLLDNSYGVELMRSNNCFVSANEIYDSFIGIRQFEGFSEKILLGANKIESTHAAGTGIALRASTGKIVGNTIVVNQDGIFHDLGFAPRVEGNCLVGVGGFGVRNADPIFTLNAPNNWWGAIDGPSGEGFGSGVAVSSYVDFTPFLDGKPGIGVAVPESVLVEVGEFARIFATYADLDGPADPVTGSVDDLLGWVDGLRKQVITVTPNAAGLAILEISVAIPDGVPVGTTNTLSLSIEGEVVATTQIVVGQQVLSAIELSAPKQRVMPGKSIDLLALGRDQNGRPMPFSPLWSTTAGTIDADGRFVAPNDEVKVIVTVSNPEQTLAANLTLTVSSTVGIGDVGEVPDTPPLPAVIRLEQNWPNPFNPSTTIKFALPREDLVSLVIYNLRGQRVRTLAAAESFEAGVHRMVWQGVDDRGSAVASGAYFYRLQTSSQVMSKRMLLLK